MPQLGGMYRGDFQRKSTLAEFGFRLPSCRDNRPLKFEEWDLMRPQTVFVSATPGPWELRPTGGVFTEHGDPAHRAHRPLVHRAPGREPGRRPDGRGP